MASTSHEPTTTSSSSSLAFQDDFTQSHGGRCFFVSVEPVFEEQITEAATLIARSQSTQAARAELIQRFAQQARDAQPARSNTTNPDHEEREAEPSPAAPTAITEDTEESRIKRRAVVEHVLDAMKSIRLEALDKEFEGFANLLLSLILGLNESTSDEFSARILTLVDALARAESRNLHPTLSTRYATIANVFNSLPVHESALHGLRLQVLLKLVQFAASNDDFLIVEPAIARLEAWLVEWGFAGPEAKDALKGDEAILTVVEALQRGEKTTSSRLAQQAKSVLVAHLTPAKKGQASNAGSEKTPEIASKLIALSLRLPNEYDFSTLASLPALAAPSVELLGELLKTFQSGSVSALEDVLKRSNGTSTLEQHGLEAEALRRKLRLLALTELCSDRVGQDVTYAEIASSLGLSTELSQDDGEEVEMWVIDAIRAGLVSGRLEQSRATLRVTRAAPRAFAESHWTTLEERLQGWRTSLDAILDSVKRGIGAGQAGAQEVASRGKESQSHEKTNAAEPIAA